MLREAEYERWDKINSRAVDVGQRAAHRASASCLKALSGRRSHRLINGMRDFLGGWQGKWRYEITGFIFHGLTSVERNNTGDVALVVCTPSRREALCLTPSAAEGKGG